MIAFCRFWAIILLTFGGLGILLSVSAQGPNFFSEPLSPLGLKLGAQHVGSIIPFEHIMALVSVRHLGDTV